MKHIGPTTATLFLILTVNSLLAPGASPVITASKAITTSPAITSSKATTTSLATTSSPIPIDSLTELQRTPSYNKDIPQLFPDFTYEDPKAAPLVHLRQKYHLDSVAGSGADTNRVIRLLSWFHLQVPHGDVRNLPVLTAENIIETYREKKYPQGCYGLAIGLNEILLSMGFKSRVVICFSNHYPQPLGGHVINTVFIPSLSNWIYIDPQENAFVKDEKGNFLSIAEVRQRLVNRLPLFLNDSGNYHGKPTSKKEYLDEFMGTNLYRMICPLNSAYNSQTRDGKTLRYVELLPYRGIEPPHSMFESQLTGNQSVICYHTSNEEVFWRRP